MALESNSFLLATIALRPKATFDADSRQEAAYRALLELCRQEAGRDNTAAQTVALCPALPLTTAQAAAIAALHGITP